MDKLDKLIANFKPREIKFGGSTDSSDFNEMNQEISSDMSNLFNQLTDNDKKISNFFDNVMIDNQYLNKQIEELKKKIDSIEKDISKIYVNFYDLNFSFGENLLGVDETPTGNRLDFNLQYNYMTLPLFKSINKTFLKDIDNQIFIPEDLGIKTSYYKNNNYEHNRLQINDDRENLIKGFDQNINTQWVKHIEKEDIDKVICEIEITLPETIITNNEANTILINPFPNGHINIEKIEIKSAINSGWNEIDIEGYNQTQGILASLPDNTQIRDIKITLEQHRTVNINNSEYFVIGCQQISVFNNKYSDTGSIFYQIDPPVRMIKINDIVPVFENINHENPIEFNRSHDINLYYIENTGVLHEYSLGDLIPPYANDKLWIKIKLNKINKASTPILKSLIIDFNKLDQNNLGL